MKMGIGIGWPNATSGGVLPLETYLISDCQGSYDPIWSQYLPSGTLLVGQRVPTTSSTVEPFYGTVIEIGTEFGDLVAEPTTERYFGCGTDSNLNLYGGPDGSNNFIFQVSLLSGAAVEGQYLEGFIDYRCQISFIDPEGSFIEREVIDRVYINSDNYNFSIGEAITIATQTAPSEGQEFTCTNMLVDVLYFSNLYNYPNYNDQNYISTINEPGQLFKWNYQGRF